MSVLLPGERPRWECALDARCSYYSPGLALDTSHVCILVRAAGKLAETEPAIGDRFHELLVAHACGGSHELMTSQALAQDDRELNLTSPHSAPRKYGDVPVDALDGVTLVDGGAGQDLPTRIGDKDRTLVAAAIAASEKLDGAVVVVTDDEAMADWVSSVAAGMMDIDVGIMASSSIDIIDRMHACGAIDTLVLTTVANVETDHLLARDISEGLLARKLARVRRIAIAAGARDARRDG